MAFAIASGVPPQAGLYTAIIAGFLISALGGSRVQIGGPTGAFVVVVAGIVARYGIDGLFMCTGIAGVFLIFLGMTGVGSAGKYIPRPGGGGFTNGIAIVIASTQLKDFFGLKIEHVPGNFLGRLEAVAQNFRTISWQETGLAVLALVLILFFRKYVPKIPGYIVALFVGTALVRIFHLPVETIGTRFGGIPSGLPALKIPQFHIDLIRPLELVKELPRGSVGVVHQARNPQQNREVALRKFEVPEWLDDAQDLIKKILAEAKAASGLDHPNIAKLYTCGYKDFTVFMTAEFIEGQTLREVMSKRQLEMAEILQIARQLCGALDCAHAKGVFH